MKNIVLVGMPGCGKSTCGVLLAKLMLMSFVDTDLIIQQKSGALLQDIINNYGIEEFAKREEEVLSSLEEKNSVISTGGSAVYSEKAMHHLKREGIVVYIKTSLDTIKSRITNFSTRGILIKKGNSLEDLFKERTPLYEKYADITVECNNENAIENVYKIIEALNLYEGKLSK